MVRGFMGGGSGWLSSIAPNKRRLVTKTQQVHGRFQNAHHTQAIANHSSSIYISATVMPKMNF